MKLLPYGERALLAELDDPVAVPGTRAAIAAVEGVVEAVAGARTVLAVIEPGALDQVRAALAGIESATVKQPHREPVEVPVAYDGADLAEVAAEVGLSVDDVVSRHAAGNYVVRFCGFSP